MQTAPMCSLSDYSLQAILLFVNLSQGWTLTVPFSLEKLNQYAEIVAAPLI